MSDKKKITMLDLVGSPSFNYTAAADALNTTNRKQLKKQKNTEGIHNFLMGLGFAPGPTGFAADIADSILYATEGKFKDAALSSVAMLPFIGSVVTAKRVKKIQEKADTSYRIDHQPRGPETPEAIRLDDLTEDIAGRQAGYPKDIYGARGQEFYARGPKQGYKDIFGIANDESYKSVMKFKNNPNAELTIYRGVPKGVKDINTGDWVTISPTYAKQHANASFWKRADGKIVNEGTVISKKVKVKDVYWAGDDINEFGYFPFNKKKYGYGDDGLFPYKDEYFESPYDKLYFQKAQKNKVK